MAMLGGIDVIGMPALAKVVVEIDVTTMPGGDGGGAAIDPLDELLQGGNVGIGPAVRLHDAGGRPAYQNNALLIDLDLRDYNRRNHPENRGPLPDLARNPVIENIEIAFGGRSSTGDWLLDTGAAASMISREQAEALGLYEPGVEPSFRLPLAGSVGSRRWWRGLWSIG